MWSCINGGDGCKLASWGPCAWSDSFTRDEKGDPECVLLGCWVVVELGNVRIGEVDDFVELEGNEERSIVLLAVKHYPPVLPIKGVVQVCLVKVVFVKIAAFLKPKDVPLADLPLDSYLPDGILYFWISTATPISIIFLASSDPVTLPIYEIPQRHQIDCSESRVIMASIWTVVELYA